MEIHQLGNQHSTRNVVKKVEVWFPQKPATAPFPTDAAGMNRGDCKTKNQSPKRLVSTGSSAETMTSQDDYGAGTDTEDEDVNGDGDAIDADVEHDVLHSNQQDTCNKHGTKEAGKSSQEDCHHYEILLWFGCSLGGVGFASCDAGGYPYVKMTDGNESLPGMWNIQEGDFLVAVNECSTHNSSMSYESVMQIVSTGARPAVLRFRRPNLYELQRIPTQKRKPTNEKRLGRRRNRERLEKTLSYVIWREGDGPLGVSLKKHRESLYPVVADMNRDSVVRRHASVGDQLISINQHDVYKLGSKRWVQLLKSAPKPLVLTFRRLDPPPNQKGDRTLDL